MPNWALRVMGSGLVWFVALVLFDLVWFRINALAGSGFSAVRHVRD
jgi:hypothetical protein